MRKIILLIASIIITILGLSLIFIQTEIQMTLLGTILMMLGTTICCLHSVQGFTN